MWYAGPIHRINIIWLDFFLYFFWLWLLLLFSVNILWNIFCYMLYSGYILQEMSSAQASTSSVLCCHFSSDGKLLATGGHDKKACGVVLSKLFSGVDIVMELYVITNYHLWLTMQVLLWNGETLTQKSTFEEHSLLITDVRFSPNTPRLATSSFDKTVRVWDVDNVCHQSMLSYLFLRLYTCQVMYISPWCIAQLSINLYMSLLSFISRSSSLSSVQFMTYMIWCEIFRSLFYFVLFCW